MKVNSALTLHKVEEAAVRVVAARLEAQGHETKISFAENQIILVTSALPRTLRKARQAKPIAQDPMNVLQNIFDSVGKYTQTPPCEVAK